MGSAVAIAFFAVLALLTLVAGRTWYERRGAAVDQAQDRVFRRFVLGLIVFWMLAVSWFLWENLESRHREGPRSLVGHEIGEREWGATRQHHVDD
jgi:hypothetical protein